MPKVDHEFGTPSRGRKTSTIYRFEAVRVVLLTARYLTDSGWDADRRIMMP